MGIEKSARRLATRGLIGRTAWSGVTTVVSGAASAVVSASAVKSGVAILHNLGVTTVASHRALVLSVNSIVDNTSFCVVTNNATVDTQSVVFAIIGY